VFANIITMLRLFFKNVYKCSPLLRCSHVTLPQHKVGTESHDVVCLQKSTPNLEGAFKYLKQHVGNKPFTPEVMQGLEEAAGVGIVVTPDQIDATVERHISKVKPQLLEQRYCMCLTNQGSKCRVQSLRVKSLDAVFLISHARFAHMYQGLHVPHKSWFRQAAACGDSIDLLHPEILP